MSGSLNKVCLIGNVGKDPEIRHTQSGGKIANLTVATSESWKDKQTGEKKEKTEWHRVVVFDERLADIIERYVTKGTKLYLEGALQTRKWTDNQGVNKYTTEVVLQRFSGVLTLLGGGGERQERKPEKPEGNAFGGDGNQPNLDDNSDIPF